MKIINPKLKKLLKKQHYQLAGKQIAVKKCRWTHNMLTEDRPCYKGYYGIQAHRCIQSSPTLICNERCIFCWRVQEGDIGIDSEFNKYADDTLSMEEKNKKYFDSPEEVIEGLKWGWKRIVSGYGSQVKKGKLAEKKYQETLNPKHVTFSLTGEPLLYPFMPELVKKLKERDYTVFIVTNGTQSQVIQKFIKQNIFPTQLYVTVQAPNRRNYLKTCRPEIDDGWQKIRQTLELIGEKYPERTVGRLTVAKTLNMTDAEGYANLLSIMKPSFIEIKGVVHVGYAQKRMERSVMPYHKEIMAFAKKLQQFLPFKYDVVAEKEESKVAILSNHTQPLVIPGLKSLFED